MSGIIMLPIFLMYILFATFMYKATTSKIILVVILIFPIWDLVIQKGIKTYYQLFKMEPKIYAMPEFDKNGKIESLGLGDVTSEPLGIFKKNEHYLIYKKIAGFVEFSTSDSKLIKVLMKNRQYEFIDKQSSRYQIISSQPTSHFFGLYQKKKFSLIDTKKDKLLAEALNLGFTDKYDYFRRNVLFWQTGTGRNLIRVKGLDNLEELIKKIFQVSTRINVYKN